MNLLLSQLQFYEDIGGKFKTFLFFLSFFLKLVQQFFYMVF